MTDQDKQIAEFASPKNAQVELTCAIRHLENLRELMGTQGLFSPSAGVVSGTQNLARFINHRCHDLWEQHSND